MPSGLIEEVILNELKYFVQMLDKHIDLVDRRLIKRENVRHEEKIFSIFEPCVVWICKGKAHDQFHLIADWWVADQLIISRTINF